MKKYDIHTTLPTIMNQFLLKILVACLDAGGLLDNLRTGADDGHDLQLLHLVLRGREQACDSSDVVIMIPHTQDLDDFLFFHYFINQPMLIIDPS